MSAQPRPDRSIAVGGDIRDSVVVLGDNNVIEVALGEDAILRRRLAAEHLTLERRALPLNEPPPRFSDHLDREREVAAILAASGHVNVHGGSGIGKTYVLLAALPAGAIYVDSAQRPLDDILQALVEELFDGSPGLILSQQRRRRELRDVEAVVALDDVKLTPQDGQRLLTEAPRLRYFVASRRRALMQAHVVRLGGLPPEHAPALLAEELGRPLSADEHQGAAALAERLSGHPLMLRQAAGLAAETGATLGALAEALGTEDPVRALSARLRAMLSPEDGELLVQLARLGGAPLAASCTTALGAAADAVARLGALEARGLVRSHSPRSTLAGALAEAPPDAGPIDPDRAASALADWAQRRSPQEILDESAALLAVLDRARGAAAVRLARALDRPLALGRRWGAWGTALEAARAAGDASGEAWALHQLGTRAYAFENDATKAIELLERALTIREGRGEAREAANTRHNLEFIRGGLPPDDHSDDRGGPPGRGVRALVAVALAVVAAAVIALVAVRGGHSANAGNSARGNPPTVTVSAFPDGASFAPGAVIRARFECTGIACTASLQHGNQSRPVSTGARLPSTPGRYTLTVIAKGPDGETARHSATYTILRAGCDDRKDPGCSRPSRDKPAAPEHAGCAAGLDNDQGRPDSGCKSPSDDEAKPPPPAPVDDIPTNNDNAAVAQYVAPGGVTLGGSSSSGAPAAANDSLQAARQQGQAAQANGQLPFTGFAAIPVLIGGLVLLTGGLLLRRRTRSD